jgi:hypothetical protein
MIQLENIQLIQSPSIHIMPRRRQVPPVPTALSEDRETINIDVMDSDPEVDNPSLCVTERPIPGPLRSLYLTNPH